MAVWDVAARPEREQFGYWHEVICRAFVPLTPRRADAAGPGFAARVETRPLQQVMRAHIASQPQATLHGPAEVARTDGAFYFLNLQVAGRCRVRQAGADAVVGPGEFTVVDTTEPYRFDFDEPWRMVSYRLPHDLLDGRGLRSRLGGRWDGRGAGGVVSAMIGALWEVEDAGPLAAAELEHALASAVPAAAAPGPQAPPGALLRSAVLRHVHGRLGDPALSVASVCRRFAISPRTLHAAFAGGEETFAATVRRLRLERAAVLLADPADTRTVTEIGASVGFLDPASFSRAFRRTHGCAPTELRGSARTAQVPRTG
ncbi:AraC family transcriptional regulator [Pseudonocardia sp. RS11V-5]|uniref:AraC family transcriptional regulator n=1 Tax=Pseudonocardia terrae TaxID=2905831 RepID=UPI001E552A69|nr:AraC family transcriptional regulator [Pseudonocardia terrae]MCE3550753.1 AraC family transcriptional regulator [Pseudonocardia terrae]